MSSKHSRSAEQAPSRPAFVESARPSGRRTMLIGLAVLSAGAIAFGIYNSQTALTRGAPSHGAAHAPAPAGAPALASFQPVYHFGAISMAAGKVRHT